MVVVAALAAAGLAAGCAEHTDASMRLAPQPKAYASDVPLPEGFWLAERKSTETFESGKRRELRHVYRGNADPSAVRDFYREQMPLCRWQAQSDRLDRGMYTMDYIKGEETCELTISAYGLISKGAQVQVAISPRPSSRGAAGSHKGPGNNP